MAKIDNKELGKSFEQTYPAVKERKFKEQCNSVLGPIHHNQRGEVFF